MALSENRDVDHYVDRDLRAFGVAAGAHIHKGAFVGTMSNGQARGLNGMEFDLFVGIAYEEADNSSGVAGNILVRVYTLGDFGLSLKGAEISNIGHAAYASDDETLVWLGARAAYVGYIVNVPAPGEIVLRLDTFRSASRGQETSCRIEVPASLFPGR